MKLGCTLIIGAACIGGSAACAQTDTASLLESIYSAPQLWDEDIPVAPSPDGKRVAYVVRDLPDKATLAGSERWLPTGAPQSATGTRIHITDLRTGESVEICGLDANTWRPSWSPNSTDLAFYSDEGGSVGLWVVNAGTVECSRLGDIVVKPKLWVGDEAQWSPDGRIIYVPLLPEGRTAGFEHEAQKKANAVDGAGRLLLYSSGAEKVAQAGVGLQGDASVDAEHYLRENNISIGAFDIESKSDKTLVSAETSPRPSVFRVSPTGRWLSYLSVWTRSSAYDDASMRQSLVVVGKDGENLSIIADGLEITERDYFRYTYSWHPTKDALVFLKKGELYYVDLEGPEPLEPKRVGATLGDLATGLHWFTRGGSRIIVGTSPSVEHTSSLLDPPPTGLAIVSLESSDIKRIDFDTNKWDFVDLIKADARTVWQPKSGTFAVQLRDVTNGELVVMRYRIKDGAATELWRGRARITGLRAATDGQKLFGAYEDIATPRDVFEFSPSFSVKKRISAIAPELNAIEPPLVKLFTTDVALQDHSLTTVRTALLLPANYDSTRPPPTIVTFYPDVDSSNQIDRFGGGNRSGVPAVAYTNRGFGVLLPFVRTGPGGEPGNVIDEMVDSLMPQIYTASAKGYVDVNRLAITGNSFGGYATAAIVSQTNLFRAAVPVNGRYDLVSATYSHPPFGAVAWTENRQPRLGAHLWDAPLKYINASPVFQADKIKTPMLIVQGGDDSNKTQAEELFVALNRLDKPAQLAIYANSGHWIAAWPREQAVAGSQRIIDFLERHLVDAK